MAGGGTDTPAFYRQYGGAVVSFAIGKYVYITLNDKFDGKTRVSYSITENVDNPAQLGHELAREVLNHFQAKGLEITSVADIPGEGTGLGSSSSFTVGLLSALSRKVNGKIYPKKMLAETAFTVEAKLCNHTGTGKQDQYAAAYGGFHYYEFARDEGVEVQPILMLPEQKKFLEDHFLLLYTGMTRSAGTILSDQEKNMQSSRESISAGMALKELAFNLALELQAGKFHTIGSYLFEGWKLKKRLSEEISSPDLDIVYKDALAAGAIGGKLCGAGGGGFFLFFADPKLHADIIAATKLRHVPFEMEEKGSEIIYDSCPAV